MVHGDDQLIQRASGLWIPKQSRFQKDQPVPQSLQNRGSVRDWEAHWKEQGQPWRRETEIDLERQQFLLQRLLIEVDHIKATYPFKDIPLTRADLEWLVHRHKEKDVGREEEQKGLQLQKAIFSEVDFTKLPLEYANFSYVHLNGACFNEAHLTGANFSDAHLNRAYFYSTQLKKAHFYSAQLEGASFPGAQLKEADFNKAQLEGASFPGAQLEGTHFVGAQLEGADFRSAKIANALFVGATIVDAQGVGPMVADVTGWDELSLPISEWSQVKLLGDEVRAKKREDSNYWKKDAKKRFDDYFTATRAYRQVATALDGMGRKEEAEKFAYRGQVMQRKMLWWSIWQQLGWFQTRTFWQRLADGRSWLFSWLLTLLSGYGYRFSRSFGWYLGILILFAVVYWHVSQGIPLHSNAPAHLSWYDAAIMSISDMVGRGFFIQTFPLSDTYAGLSVLEGMIGVFMDVFLISTLTQRLFKK